MAASKKVAKKRGDSRGSVPTFWASVDYKKYVKQWLAADSRRTYQWFADEIVRLGRAEGVTCTNEAISQFLGKRGKPIRGSNTSLMPYMNRIMGLPAPSIFAPEDQLAMLREALIERWERMSDRDRDLLRTLLLREQE